jgi:5-methylcytosine-specific restriction protein A
MYDMSMFAAIAELEIPTDGPGLLELLAAHDQLTAKVCEAVGDFDARSMWDLDAATSMHAWLRDQARMTPTAANRLVKTSRKLRVLPMTLEAWKAGGLSGGQVEVVVSTVGRHVEHFDEEALVPLLAQLSLNETITAMQRWRERVDAHDGPDDDIELDVPSRVHLSEALDGRGVLDGDLDADTNQLLKAALRLADSGDLDVPLSERQGEAVGVVSKFFLDHQQTRKGGRHRPHINILHDLDTGTARYLDGPTISRQVLEEYFCDSAFHRVLTTGRSTILDYGMSTRVLTAALWAALAARDQGCRFPGCDRPVDWCDGHHVIWFSHHGPTRLDNLVLLCRRHHKRLHKPGWEAKLLPDATLEVTDPQGHVRTSHPPGTLQPSW